MWPDAGPTLRDNAPCLAPPLGSEPRPHPHCLQGIWQPSLGNLLLRLSSRISGPISGPCSAAHTPARWGSCWPHPRGLPAPFSSRTWSPTALPHPAVNSPLPT